MSHYVKERYTIVTVGVNSTVTFQSDSIGGFLALTGGTVSIKDYSGNTVINAVPVIAGGWTPLPFFISSNGGQVITAGGASG